MVFERIRKFREGMYDFLSTANKTAKNFIKGSLLLAATGLIWYVTAPHAADDERLKRENKQLKEQINTISTTTISKARDNKLERILDNTTARLKVFKGYEDSRYQEYDSIIQKYVEQWNKEYSSIPGFKPLDPDIVKSMIIQESGANRDKDGAWKYDPFQMANKGDDGLRVLRDGLENSIPNKGYEELHGIMETPRRNGKWDYGAVPKENRITAELSLEYGTRFLFQKAFIFDKDGKPIGLRPWNEAVSRYNGGGTPGYAKQVLSRLKEN
jgi:hypothetical protein